MPAQRSENILAALFYSSSSSQKAISFDRRTSADQFFLLRPSAMMRLLGSAGFARTANAGKISGFCHACLPDFPKGPHDPSRRLPWTSKELALVAPEACQQSIQVVEVPQHLRRLPDDRMCWKAPDAGHRNSPKIAKMLRARQDATYIQGAESVQPRAPYSVTGMVRSSLLSRLHCGKICRRRFTRHQPRKQRRHQGCSNHGILVTSPALP